MGGMVAMSFGPILTNDAHTMHVTRATAYGGLVLSLYPACSRPGELEELLPAHTPRTGTELLPPTGRGTMCSSVRVPVSVCPWSRSN